MQYNLFTFTMFVKPIKGLYTIYTYIQVNLNIVKKHVTQCPQLKLKCLLKLREFKDEYCITDVMLFYNKPFA